MRGEIGGSRRHKQGPLLQKGGVTRPVRSVAPRAAFTRARHDCWALVCLLALLFYFWNPGLGRLWVGGLGVGLPLAGSRPLTFPPPSQRQCARRAWCCSAARSRPRPRWTTSGWSEAPSGTLATTTLPRVRRGLRPEPPASVNTPGWGGITGPAWLARGRSLQ